MPLKDIVDKDGNHFKVLDVNGFYLPDFEFEHQERDFRLMADLWQARDDDILLCNYAKSGTHWIWEIIQMLYQQKAEFLTNTKESLMMETLTKERFDSLASPRVLNSHIYFSMLPKDIFKRRCKIIYSIRNPKDIAVSFYHHHHDLLGYNYNGTWDSYLPRFLAGDVDFMSWFDYVHQAQKFIEENEDYPIHVIQYEDMHLDYINEIKKIAEFLDIKYSEKLIQDIADKCKFDVMKKGKAQISIHWRDDKPGMYRQGKVGGWKNVFTVAQNELFDKVYKEKMADLNLDLKFSI